MYKDSTWILSYYIFWLCNYSAFKQPIIQKNYSFSMLELAVLILNL